MTDQAPELLTPKQFIDAILSACDASNWDAERNTGAYFRGLRDAYENIQEIAIEYQTAMYRWNTRPPSERGITPHGYEPDNQAMGDCRICGHVQDKQWHTERPVAQMREALELADKLERTAYQPTGDDEELIIKALRALTAERPEAAVAWAARTIFDELCPGIRWDERDRPAYESAARKILYAIQHEEPGREMHVEYVASRGQSKVTYWVTREEGDRIRRAALSPAQRDIGR